MTDNRFHMNKSDTNKTFRPSDVGQKNGRLFGLPFEYEDSRVVVLPVPWEVTASYRTGTSKAPLAILDASVQVDLFDPVWPDGWRAGFFMLPTSDDIAQRNVQVRRLSQTCMERLEKGVPADDPDLILHQGEVNAASSELNDWVERQAQAHLSLSKTVGILGGDHSVSLGLIRALATRFETFGVLHIDAHADLRRAYEGFQYSHASIMENVLHLPHVSKLVQVGIRDYCEEEEETIREAGDRVSFFPMRGLRKRQFHGEPWARTCQHIVETLPQQVYVSFDIDGLEPTLCPETGTPVPGGLSWDEAVFLLDMVVDSGRQIIGFDLVEVSGNAEWDAIVGARLLYRLCLLASQHSADNASS